MLSKWTLHMHICCLYFLSNICCPVKSIRAQVSRRDKPWITNGLKMPVVRKTDCIKYGFILKRLQLNPDTKITKINLPQYLEQQKKNTTPNYFLMLKVTSKIHGQFLMQL